MRATKLGTLIAAALVAGSSHAYAAGDSASPLPPPASGEGTGAGTVTAGDNSGPQGPSQSAPPPGAEAPTETLPPPAPNTTSGSGAATATPEGPAKAEKPEDWKMGFHGYFRAPLRIGTNSRPPCAAGAMTPTTPGAGMNLNAMYCAQPGQSGTVFHTPYIPDDQYLAWTFDRQWEQSWAELFFSYGNRYVTGTVGIQGYDFTDASLLGNSANPAQFGIGQGWLTLTPDLPVSGLRLNWKVGAFWAKYGMAGKYDGGHYDTYMFGRLHQMGEAVGVQYDAGDFTLKVEHGFGAHLEMAAAGLNINGDPTAQASISNPANPVQLGASPGFTLVDHVHAGVTYKKVLDINAHYLLAWSQDDREQGSNMASTASNVPLGSAGDGSMAVYGAEGRFLGGVFGELYAAYSHIDAKNVWQVGPAIEVVHSSGGGGHNAGNGLMENFFNGHGSGTGKIDNVQFGYDFSFGYLLRKLQNANAHFWGDGQDVRLSVFAMYSQVSTPDSAQDSHSPYTGLATNGTKKLKYGADLSASLFPWLGVGLRADYVQPDSQDTSMSFGVASPRIMIHSKYITHEEITLQYSHYWPGANAPPEQYVSQIGYKNLNNQNSGFMTNPTYPVDPNVFGIKCTIWW